MDCPTFITGEDSISIQVLLDESSPEMKWLMSTYSQLRDEVLKNGAKFAVVLLPLAYQLDKGYPFAPQTVISSRLKEENIHCLDLLPSLRMADASSVFLLYQAGEYDVWHLTRFGHQLVAQAIADFLASEDLLNTY